MYRHLIGRLLGITIVCVQNYISIPFMASFLFLSIFIIAHRHIVMIYLEIENISNYLVETLNRPV